MTAEDVYYLATALGILITFLAFGANYKNAQNKKVESQRKEENLQKELKNRDKEIAKVKSDSAEKITALNAEAEILKVEAKRIETEGKENLAASNERIATLNAQAEALKSEAEKAKREIAIAAAEAAMANERAQEIERQNLQLGLTLEAEHNKRLELEKSLAPRELSIVVFPDGTRNYAPLLPFSGMQVIVEYINDAEAQRAARYLSQFLGAAGLKTIKVTPHALPTEILQATLFDGIAVEPYRSTLSLSEKLSTPNSKEKQDENKSYEAAKVFVNLLKANNWDAHQRPGTKGDIPPNTIKISVGFKTNRYFWPQEIKDALNRVDELIKESERPRNPPDKK